MIRLFKNRFIDPLIEFIHDSKAIGVILLLCTAFSLLLSNIPGISEAYRHLWSFHFDGSGHHNIHFGFLSLPNSPKIIINDFLMAFFFLLAGMEIKREMMGGELATLQKSALPMMAAIGGMIMPAVFFMQLNRGTDNLNGWAIPTATDIAFTLGIASLLGNRVPVALKIFLTALAIIDDLGAIMVIALFYGAQLQWMYLLACALVSVLLWLLNTYKKRFGILHIALGILLWYCMFNSGIHATVAGVVFALFIPVKELGSFEMKLHIPVYFLIIPLFALANTAIAFPANSIEVLTGSLSWGVIVGLCIGKPLGICGACYFMVKKRWATLPSGINWHQMIGAGLLAGIGFTMSIFISTLAFDTAYKQDVAKISVLLASLIAMLAGYFWLKWEKEPE